MADVVCGAPRPRVPVRCRQIWHAPVSRWQLRPHPLRLVQLVPLHRSQTQKHSSHQATPSARCPSASPAAAPTPSACRAARSQRGTATCSTATRPGAPTGPRCADAGCAWGIRVHVRAVEGGGLAPRGPLRAQRQQGLVHPRAQGVDACCARGIHVRACSRRGLIDARGFQRHA